MKQLAIVALCLGSGIALAENADDEELIDELEVRLSEIEVIDVTAEKTPVDTQQDLDADIEAILEKADELEAEDTAE